MKPVRFILVLLAAGLLVTAFAPLPLSNSVAQQNAATSSAHVQNPGSNAIDLSLQSPLAFLASAPAITVAVQSSSSNYACALVSQTPPDWTVMQKRQYFDAKWTVRNSGIKTWTTSGVEFKYISGTKMQTNGNVYHLKANVSTGKKVTLTADMNAPKTYGYYTANWALYNGSYTFCVVTISIGVWKP